MSQQNSPDRAAIEQLVRDALTEKIGGAPTTPTPAENVIDESVKTVITESDVLSLAPGQKLLIRAEAIITPAAQDVIRERGIELRYRSAPARGGKQRVIAVGSDHGGFAMKEQLKAFLAELGYPVRDFGAFSEDVVDYPDLAHAVARAVADAETRLGDTGRVLLRKSGTEPLVRVMVEAPDEATAESVAAALADVVRAELSL